MNTAFTSTQLEPHPPKNPLPLEGQPESDLIQPMTTICTFQDAMIGTAMATNNCFTVLTVEELELPVLESTSQDEPLKERPPHLQLQPKWERQLPKHFIIATNPSMNSFELLVSIQTTDMGDIHLMKGLLDCGASVIMSSDFVKRKQLMIKPLTHPLIVYNVNGSLNKAGSISEVINIML